MKRKLIVKIVLILGIVFLILAPILGYTTDKLVLLDQKPIVINEDSEDGLQKSFAFPFSLESHQKISIEFSVYYANVSATLKIFGRGFYDQRYSLNSSPTGLTGLDFVYSQFVWGQSPSTYTGSDNERTFLYDEDGYWYIEFAGDTSGDYLISIPGSYVIVVYGDNNGPPSDTTVSFNLVVKIDGPGDFLEELFYYIGAGVIGLLVLFISYSYYKKFKGGR
ncbi:MAG: hypothetical protein JSV23_03855 [Promethearchaeota archaeon]|nr:MAG: hypothetical protein JSV23_03855 [Candidatus Lokiarchaeota archaeon]